MEQDPGRILSEARRLMVEHRRSVIKTLASGYDREQMEAHINMILKIQSAIDVIDRVSQDERALGDAATSRQPGRRLPGSSGPG
jgi:hypothetical protein